MIEYGPSPVPTPEVSPVNPDAALKDIRTKRKQALRAGKLGEIYDLPSLKNPRETQAKYGYEQLAVFVRREAASIGEQSPEDIAEIQDGLRAISESEEVQEARRVISKPLGPITIRKGMHAFTIHPDMLGIQKGSILSISRTSLDREGYADPESLWMVDASFPDLVTGMGVFEAMRLYNEFPLEGPEAITVAKELIRSFNNPVPLES